MTIKDELIKVYQDKKVVKTSDQITGDIIFWMERGRRELFHEKTVISDDIIEEFREKGFRVEPYRDEHSKEQGIEMVCFSW